MKEARKKWILWVGATTVGRKGGSSALFTAQWLALNERLSAIKTARESRASGQHCPGT
jgi:hypothetical protein